ncbi:MAG: aminotransferase class I/II-fold pyridoxal phosphate-dependent enzyme [Timaviella obliquedivisa GSE-PSE-MK23-08B]|jgi:myxalamid-type polyketide synthase MxaB|nr:aminotransferase class I/II-fold pyridoxal phosphate-dependent enzyme [Timaviella obliquedivisa GSE-PSE-MK23-08B]
MKLEPVAIIGIGCRFPGANNPEAFWQLLRNGVDAITEIPCDRWDNTRFYDPDPTQPNKTNQRWGGFLDQVDQFDPQFFGIAPREASSIDPQQRIILEVAWEALEDAGQVPGELAGSQTGVFVGIGTHDYSVMLWQNPVNDPYATTGTGNCIAANRISYALDLRGPSLAIDTACSSSLVSVHLACQSLWQGESTLALAGGVNVLLLPTAMVGFTKSGLMAADGRCKTFDAAADGYVRSEGAGIVVLKPLKQAKREGDRIYAVIRGGAVNQDGRSNGLTAPNPQAQEAVLRRAYAQAGVSPGQVRYVEVHGTGTKLGDPMELKALGTVLAEGRPLGQICAIGSVKTNIGHTETAAGIAGLIKVALALQHRELPPSLHFRQPNPYIDFQRLSVRVQERLEKLEGEAIAGVSAFGFGGTNAHIILESVPSRRIRTPKKKQPVQELHLLTLSAKTEQALHDIATQLQVFLEEHSECLLTDVCYTANVGRSHFSHRLAIIAESLESLRHQLYIFTTNTRQIPTRKPPIRQANRNPQLAEIDWQLPQETLLQQVAERYVQGEKIDWATFYQAKFYQGERDRFEMPVRGRLISLPTYPFQRQRFWAEGAKLAIPQPPEVHPLLGQRLQLAGVTEVRFQVQIHPQSYLKDHCIFGQPIFPAAAYLKMLRTAGAQVMLDPQVQQFRIERSLPLIETQILQIVLKPEKDYYIAQIFRRVSDESWTLQASAQINHAERREPVHSPFHLNVQQFITSQVTKDIFSIVEKEWRSIPVDEFYRQLQDQGLEYGANFQGIQNLWQGEDQAIAQIQLSKDLQTHLYKLHPSLLDAGFQTLGALLSESYLPVGCDRFQVFQTLGDRVWSHVQITSRNAQQVQANISLMDDDGAIVAEVINLSLRVASPSAYPLPEQKNERQSEQEYEQHSEWLYKVNWQPKNLETQSSVEQKDWLIFADREGLGILLAKQLEMRGDRCTLVFSEQVDLTQPEDFRAWVNQRIAQNIIYLWSLEEAENLDLYSLQNAQIQGCAGVLHLVQALAESSARLWLVTRATQAIGSHAQQLHQSSLWGLAQVIRAEYPNLYCVSIDLDMKGNDLQILQQELDSTQLEEQIAYRRENASQNAKAERYVARLIPYTKPSIPPESFRLQGSGTLDNLVLAPYPRRTPAPHEVEIQVCAAGVNFRDVLNALGMLDQCLSKDLQGEATSIPFGGECAGRIITIGQAVRGLCVGDEVIAAQAIGSLGSFVTVDARFVAQKPKEISFVEAATIPIAFLTADYGLKLAKLKKGDRILIHSAAGGVGQAAVQIAQQVGAEIYATASPAKWQFLKSQGIQHVMNSRTLEFAQDIKTLTQGKGVNVVFNSLNGDFIPRSLEALAPGGRFVEIGKIGIWTAQQMHKIRSDVAYLPFDLLDISNQKPSLMSDLLQTLLPRFQQDLKPLPYTVFSITEAASAFRYMAQAQHWGKVVISFPNPFVTHENASYLITGGVGVLGLEAAKWLVERGAKHLILTWHKNFSESAKLTIAQLEKSGAVVQVIQANVVDQEAIAAVLKPSNLPPLRGIIHAAGSLDDGALTRLTWQRFQQVMAPKVFGAWNLHQLTQHLPLDFFVCFSSAAALLGSPGQGNYAAANAFLDALMHERRRLGLPGLSVNWSAWSEGMATRVGQKKLAARGIGSITPSQGFQILENLLEEDATQVAVLPIDWAVFGAQISGRKLAFLNEILKPHKALLGLEASHQSLLHLENSADLTEKIQGQVAKILGFSASQQVDLHQKFDDMGMDSLMAVELSNYVRTLLGSAVPLDLAFEYPTIALLVDYLFQQGYTHRALQAPNRTNGSNGKSQDSSPDPVPDVPLEFYQFSRSPEYLNMQSYLQEVGKAGNPFFTVHDGVAGDIIQTNGKELINYASYNYLGMSGHAKVNAVTKAAIDRYGTSVSASRVVSGERFLHRELEQEIADFLGAEETIVYVGGHTTNTTTIGHLFGKSDLILYDALSHNSIRQGCALSNAAAIEFPHNDWRSLELLLSQQRRHYEKVLIAIEGIYSTDGDIAPLPEIVRIKNRHKAFLLVDEAHSIGVLGKHGRGIGEYFGVPGNQVDLWMGTLSKSFASCGGYIAGCRALVEYLKYTAPGFVFSVGMSPPNTASALAALRQLKAEPERVTQLHERSALFLKLAKKRGLNTGMSQNSPVIPIIVGEAEKAIALSQNLAQRGINAQPMIHPSVPHNAARLRFFISCTHTEEQIRLTVETLAEAIAQIEAAV